jgi:diguanylate cyclase (GGDEF)-like protein
VVSENPVEVRELAIPITVSIGVAEAQGEMDARTLIHQADVALYSAKKAGRKCVKVYSKELEIQPENNLHAK